jgi:hypothetical protein
MTTKKITLIIIAATLLTIFFSCRKKDTTTSTPPTPKGDLYFHLHTNIDTTEADSGIVCSDAAGRKFQLNIAQFYLSGIALKKTDGSVYNISGAYVLKTISEEVYMVASGVPAGNYSSVSFNVGIDASTNQTDPASHSPGPLAMQDPSMWFGSTSQGYIFVNVQGLADTSATHTGTVNYPFSYKLGTSSLLRTVNMPSQAFSVVANQSAVVHMVADCGKLLEGVNFKTQNSATPFGNAAEVSTAAQIANNIQNMFRYEE